MKKLKIVGFALGTLLFAMSGTRLAVAAGNTTNEQNQSVISSTVAQVAATANVGMISTRITALTSPGGGSGSGGTGLGKGQSSGNGPNGIGVWGLVGANYLDSSKSGAKYDGSLMNAMVGTDKQIGDLVVGLAFGYENLDLTTKYNSGKMQYDGLSLTPYLSYSINKDLVADASFTYTWLDYTMKDTQAGVSFRDTMGANRMVTSAGLSQYMTLDKLLLSARLGTLYLNEHQGSYQLNATPYSAAGIYTWQGSLGLRGTYDMGSFKPFLGATYMQDIVKSGGKEDDMWGTDFDLGFNYNVSDSFLIGLTGTFGLRENLTKTGGMLNVRYDF